MEVASNDLLQVLKKLQHKIYGNFILGLYKGIGADS